MYPYSCQPFQSPQLTFFAHDTLCGVALKNVIQKSVWVHLGCVTDAKATHQTRDQNGGNIFKLVFVCASVMVRNGCFKDGFYSETLRTET